MAATCGLRSYGRGCNTLNRWGGCLLISLSGATLCQAGALLGIDGTWIRPRSREGCQGVARWLPLLTMPSGQPGCSKMAAIAVSFRLAYKIHTGRIADGGPDPSSVCAVRRPGTGQSGRPGGSAGTAARWSKIATTTHARLKPRSIDQVAEA